VQIGWCVKRDSGWYIEDMNGRSLAGPFRTLDAADSASRAAPSIVRAAA
jgi:hypothetical protein